MSQNVAANVFQATSNAIATYVAPISSAKLSKSNLK